jgi:hypothetical protein
LIFDFTSKDAGKNFEILDPTQFQLVSKEIEGIDAKPVFPFALPKRYGGTIEDDVLASNAKEHDAHSDMKSFGFNVSQQEAQKHFEHEEENDLH